jgi:hypothetical protein
MQERRAARLAEHKPVKRPRKQKIEEPEVIPEEPEIKEPEPEIKESKIKTPKKIDHKESKKISKSKFRELYDLGYTDRAIAKICDCRPHDV